MTIKEPEIVTLPTLTGPMRTHVFRPAADGKYPGIVMFSEIFQVTGPIRRTAAFLAGHGFIVAVPEIYHEFEAAGSVLGYDQVGADRGNALKITKELSHTTPTLEPSSIISPRAPTARRNSAPWASASAAISPSAPP